MHLLVILQRNYKMLCPTINVSNEDHDEFYNQF
jgi:hypothetical protein